MLRRSLLAGAAAFTSSLSLPRLGEAALPTGDRQILHVLDRLAFGPTQEDFRRIKAVGIDRYIAEQLAPETIPERSELDERLGRLTTPSLDPIALFREYGPRLPAPGMQPNRDEQQMRRRRARIIVQETSLARVWRAYFSARQLQEVMTDFWFNHFNIFAFKGLDYLWLGSYEEAIRRHALGHFRDLLLATARHPAMLFYLDNWENSVEGSKMPNGRAVGLNENYARELMELHTLGVEGGYSQDDVVALARILTGWGLARPRVPPPDRTGFFFDMSRHEWGDKRFLGHDIAAGGEREGIAALSLLAQSPATARHIATKLAQYFVADQPPPALVAWLVMRFQETDGDIRAVLQTLFASAEFRTAVGAKYKTPYRYVLSAARAAGAAPNNPRPLLNAMGRQGQPLYACATPDGYKDTAQAWLGPDATLARINFATAMGEGRLPLRAAPETDQPVIEVSAPNNDPPDAGALEALLGPVLGKETQVAVAAAPEKLRAALILGSPEFMQR